MAATTDHTGPVLYEVNLIIDASIREAFLPWLNSHMAQMVALDGFVSARAFINEEDENQIICHYQLRDMAAMRSYLAGPAKDMRADGIARFGDQFTATRRIMHPLK